MATPGDGDLDPVDEEAVAESTDLDDGNKKKTGKKKGSAPGILRVDTSGAVGSPQKRGSHRRKSSTGSAADYRTNLNVMRNYTWPFWIFKFNFLFGFDRRTTTDRHCRRWIASRSVSLWANPPASGRRPSGRTRQSDSRWRLRGSSTTSTSVLDGVSLIYLLIKRRFYGKGYPVVARGEGNFRKTKNVKNYFFKMKNDWSLMFVLRNRTVFIIGWVFFKFYFTTSVWRRTSGDKLLVGRPAL